MTSKTRVVVIGGGMAAARLAQQLSTARATVDLTVIGEEPHPPYNRVLLAEVIELPAPPVGRRLSGVRAVRVDRGERMVLCDDGGAAPYDRLVLATGSNPVLPPVRGLFAAGPGDAVPDGRELPANVHAFRTLTDCLALAGALRPGMRAVVIGGGLLGVSAARALAERGIQTVLAHQGEHLMERQLDSGASLLLRRHLVGLGVEVHTECRVRGLLPHPRPEPDGNRSVGGVELADGYRLEADVVVLACGVRPRVGLARAAGLAVGRGITVDDELRTSDPTIHAIGDCAEHNGVLYGLAGAAQEQADALARVLTRSARTADVTGTDVAGTTGATGGNVAGATPGTAAGAGSAGGPGASGETSGPAEAWISGDAYTGTRSLTRLTLATPPGSVGAAPGPEAARPLDLAAFGEIDPRPDDDVVHLTDATRGVYRKVVVRGDRLVGGILLGDLGTVGALARTWEGDEPLSSAPLLHLLTNDGGT